MIGYTTFKYTTYEIIRDWNRDPIDQCRDECLKRLNAWMDANRPHVKIVSVIENAFPMAIVLGVYYLDDELADLELGG